MQLGFDLVYTDPNTQEIVPWAMPDAKLFARIEAAPWKVVDVETTGLNPASKEQKFSGKELRRGINPVLRLRILSVLYPMIGTATGYDVVAFDFDQMTQKEREQAATASMNNVVIAHNAGFDAYWIRQFTKVTPKLLLDSMLMARVLRPEHPLVMARICNDENEDPDIKSEAEAMFMQGRSGWSLADLSVGVLRRILPKGLQGPKNWAEPFLTQANYNYATDDVKVLHDLLLALFDIDSCDQLLERYYELRAENRVLRIIEPQVLDIVVMREHGMPWDQAEAARYIEVQWDKVRQFAKRMVELEPALAKFERDLGDAGKGITANLKTAIGEAFAARGLELEMTEKSNTFKIGEKDLRRARAQVSDEARELFDTWVGLNRAKKAGGMAMEVTGYAVRSPQRDSRLHPNTGHGPVTGRLSSSEPNCFTGDTEILTPQGWVRFDELDDETKVAQYDDGRIEFVDTLDVIREDWEGTLVHNRTSGTDLLTTPMHRCLLIDPVSKKQRVVMAEDYPEGYRQLHGGMYAGGEGLGVSEAELRFIVMGHAAGSWEEDGSFTLRFSRARKAERFLKMFANLDPMANVLSTDARSFRFGPTHELTELAELYLGHDYEFGFGEWVYALSREQIEVFFDELTRTDATHSKPTKSYRTQYVAKRKSDADTVQALYALSGAMARVQHIVDEKTGEESWTVKVVQRDYTVTTNRSQELVPYKGKVYCVTVPSSFIVVRHGDSLPMVTGQCQQFPRDQGFRNCVMAPEGYKIMASDYSALDMRVGAALAIRAQRHIFEAYMGDRAVHPDVARVIARVYEGKISLEAARAEEARAAKAFGDWKARREDVADAMDARKRYWEEYRKRARTQLLAGFQRCLKEVRLKADSEGTSEWGSLRDAFNIEGMDIHTWTALGMVGEDPKALFSGLSGEDVAKSLKEWKKKLGDKRQTGKVGNLSLLYAMKTQGLMDAAAKNYNIHWTFEEADKVRNDWLAAYVEIDLWHKWTELNPAEQVYVPDFDRGGKFAKKEVYASYTLGDRLIYAFGLNAALSYEDQSTGADILGLVMQTLREFHPDIFDCVINQVHDELVFMLPDEKAEEWTDIVQKVMTECAEHFLMQFGVRGECSPATGQVWLKD
jgi:hypothetical protein